MRPSVRVLGRFTGCPHLTANGRGRTPEPRRATAPRHTGRFAKMRGRHESHPARRRPGHAASAAHAPHPEAHRPDLRSAVSALSDRPAAAGARDRRNCPQPQLPAPTDRGRLRRRLRSGRPAAVRRGAEAARHRAEPSSSPPADYHDGPLIVLQRRRLHVGGPAGRAPACTASARPGRRSSSRRSTIPRPMAWSRPSRTAASGRSSRSRSPGKIRCDTINAGIYILEPETLDRIPPRHAVLDRARLLPVAHRGRRATFVAHVYRGYWIDIGTPDKYRQAHRDIMDGRFVAPPFAETPGQPVVSPAARRSMTARRSRGPCFIDAGAVLKRGRARSDATASSAGTATSAQDAVDRGRHPVAAHAGSTPTPAWVTVTAGQHCHLRPERPDRRRRDRSATSRS